MRPQGEGGAPQARRVGSAPLDDAAPQQGENDEQAAVSGVGPGEVKALGLQGGEYAVQHEDKSADQPDPPRAALAQP